ncbi:MAG: creatininase family protein [bacterium]|nr:creatininase family protein [bacterium]
MANQVLLAKLTRREFREALFRGEFQTAIIPVGSNEQHLEHLAMEHDTASATHVAVEAAKRLYPNVVVNVPMAIGISEHHMTHKGTVTAKPGSWLAVLFDAVESLVRHGVKNVIVLNGHGGNVAPLAGNFDQWRLFFKIDRPDVHLRWVSYWDLIPKEFAEQHLKTKRYPGHAQEFETAFALALWPENVRHDAMRDQPDKEPLSATAEAGRALVEESIVRVTEFTRKFMEGGNRGADVAHHP